MLTREADTDDFRLRLIVWSRQCQRVVRLKTSKQKDSFSFTFTYDKDKKNRGILIIKGLELKLFGIFD